LVAPKRALLSVFDKRGITELARFLADRGVEIISTGGTASILDEANIPFCPISEYTLYPELMNGRVKTLHPKIHGGILARRDKEHHLKEAAEHGIELIDLVCVNLYPFESVVRKGCTLDEAIENIDIGGPTLIRAAAKNFEAVVVLTDPADYEPVMKEIEHTGKVSLETRKRLAVKAFRHTANYDAKIDTYLSSELCGERVLRLMFTQGRVLRYGENWHQRAELYVEQDVTECTLPKARQLHGKQMSYNNYVDLDCALQCVRSIAALADDAVVAIVKHNNPCGLATGKRLSEVLQAAWAGDPISAFGSLICTNRPFDMEAAAFLKDKFVEAVLAPSFEPDALNALKAKSPNIRLLELEGDWSELSIEYTYRYIPGGMLRQTRDTESVAEWRCVSRRQFPEHKVPLAMFSWVACKHTRSNAIVIAEEYAPHAYRVLSMGAGQPNRVDSIRRLAIPKAYDNLKMAYGLEGEELEEVARRVLSECVLSSDAFFPFADSIEAAAQGHIQYIVSPGGSIRDDEVIAAADRLNIAMVFTKMRHFLH